MATSNKKTTSRSGSTSRSGGKRTSTNNSGGRSGSSSRAASERPASSAGRNASRKSQPPSKPIRREVGALVCLFLALVAGLGYFKIDAIFINFFSVILKGLFGYGFWLAPPCLLVAAYILGFHRGRPVRLRLWCALLVPVVMGALLHLYLSEGDYPWAWSMVTALWKDGQAIECGGAVSGLLAISFQAVLSRILSTIVFVVALLLMVLCAFNRTIIQIVDAIRNLPHPEYERKEREPKTPKDKRRGEPEAESRPEPEPKTTPAAAPQPDRRPDIDFPVEDGPLVGVPEEDPLKPKGKKDKLFDSNRRVPTPAEFLTGAASRPPVSEPEEEPAAVESEDFPADPFPAQPAPAKEPAAAAPAIPKVTAQEAAQAAQEVSAEISENLTETPAAYQYPPVSLLQEGTGISGSEALGELKLNQERLADTIRSFGVEARITNVVRGPSVTRYEMELEQGVKLNKITNLADDIALALGAESVRIAPIPEKISTVGIEVPNKLVSTVHIHEVIDSKEFRDHSSKVAFSVGKDIGGNCIVGNIARLPHLLIAGTTGSGKSVCTNSLIISLLYKATPDEVRLIMVDPKMVELGIYNGIPHLLIPVVTDPKKAAGALQWAVVEMMKRYRAFSELGVRDLAAYNAHAARTEGVEKMPQIVVLIDELADLMLVAAKEVEESICRVAQMGRAAGMHLVIATQRPSADVITGLMKANIPSRIAFAVSSALESRIILDTMGAEKLVGKGDMLWYPLGAGKPKRVQGCFVTDEEVAAVVEFVKKSGSACYDEAVIHEIEQHAEAKEKSSKGVGGSAPDSVESEYDELLPSAIEVVLELGQASVSMLQRRLKLGYGRAARLVDQMEEKGIVGPFEGSKPRQLLITKEQWQEMQFRQGLSGAPAADQSPAMTELDDDTPPFDSDDEDF